MGSKDISKDVLNVVKRKTGKNITDKDIKNVASGIGPSTIKSEQQLRQLIKQVSKMANVPVAESTVQELVREIKKSGINPNNMEQMIKSILGNK
jgi:ribosomal protein L12E/L44/L45/RPP1/RPP2